MPVLREKPLEQIKMIPRYDGILLWGFCTAIDVLVGLEGWGCLFGFWLGYAIAQSNYRLIDRFRNL